MMKKGKKIIVIVSALCLIAALLIGGIILFAGNSGTSAPAVAVTGNTEWYDETGKEFLITTVEELYGLAELSKTHDFKGQTVKLGADIVINKGDASKWADKAPEYLWNPIVGFAGTFDGQGYTISGVYGNSIVTSLGLFTDTQKSCVIRDLKLVNSCFKNNNDMGTGSIIGVGGGTLENIYSDAVMVSSGKYVGGLIGCVKTKGENQITNCWFDGQILMDGYDSASVGGLVGAFTVEDAINTIVHCLSTADISCMGENVGGICGNVGNGAFLNLSDSMFTGTLEYDTNKYAVVGSVIGQVMGSASIIVNDTYTVDEIANRTIGTSGGYQKGNAIAVARNYLLGQGGYQWTTLDFDQYWVAQKDGMPRLRYFTAATESISGVEKMVDISWYDQAGAAFEITTVQQLYGFAYLSRSYDFRGQTIKLGADITVNEGDASTWGKKAPAYNWTPIAWYGSSLSQRFKGTFDGQGHTISGIYAKGTENITSLGLFGEVYHGAVVKNFKLVNSYFEGVQSADIRGPVGSIAGRLRGTIENVYSDAIVVNSSKNTGGIVGMITGSGQNTISGCWFDGTITGITRTGGILGGVYGNKGNIEATIEHCLNTGDISVEIGQAAVGGICGSVETWSILNVNDCLNAGTYQTVGTGKTASSHIGTLVGTVTQTDGVGSKAVITDSYGVKEFYDRLVGWEFEDVAVEQKSMMYVGLDELIGYGGYQWTSLDFKDHWAVRTNDIPVPVAFAQTIPSVAGMARMVDYSWYNPNQDAYIIWTYQQLYGVARLWEVTNLFKDKTVLLGTDITLNTGNAADWAKKAPALVWEPMKFRGTFNGQGHTISGIYVKGGADDNYVGLFHRIYQGATVKNLKLTNSYIEGTMASSERGAVGSIAGRSNGIIDTVYSDAIVVNSARMTGGLVGMITGEGQNQIRNSWFDGQVTGITRTGGILGGMYGNKQDIKVTIADCANTGHIAVQIGSGDVGGICGMAETGGTLTITNCLNAGTYGTVGDGKEANTHIGSVFGSVTEKDGTASHVVLNNVYGVEDFYTKLIGWSYGAEGVSESVAVMLSMDKLTEKDGYRYAALDYANTWGLNGEYIPVPKAFGTVAPDAAVLEKQVDYSWYDVNSDVYTITTPEQLMGFAVLCNGQNDYFKGKTVKLGADITLNAGKAADWAATAPENVWTPINFGGTFDGQGHTLSGVYVKTDKQYNGFFSTVNSGATVKNLKLVNSYIEGNGTETRSGVGSIAGRNLGTIDTVYSNAILVNSKQMAGGIAGMSTGSSENTIRNCWFDGQINAVGSTGGILGGTYAATATVEHCLNTGTLNIESGNAIGGLCGYAQSTGGITVRDSLNAGAIVKGDGTIKQVGALVGAVHADASLTLSNAFGVEEFSDLAVGYSKNNVTKETDSTYGVRNLADIKGYGAYQWMTLDFETTPYWVLRKDAIPALSVFDKADLDVKDAKTLPDYRWYDDDTDVFVITTVEQLRGFNDLCTADTDYFKGKTVKLGADITLNEGNAADWAAKAPAVLWKSTNFSGIFDGQGHTISGVYVSAAADATYTGLFSTVTGSAAVRNLKLVNSYIEGTQITGRCGTGSIAGRNMGMIDTVYSSAIVKNVKGAAMTGGIAGMSDGGTIVNCWFDGQVHGGRATGGILGGAYAKAANIEHCLNTGAMTVNENSYYVGGLCGELQNAAVAVIKDSLNAGSLTGTVIQSGAIVGRVDTLASLTMTDSYGVSEFVESSIGEKKGAVTGSGYAVRKLDNIKGLGAYQWMTLDFETAPYWVLKADAIPALATFDTTDDLKVSDAKALPDYRMYDDSSNVFVITTAQQLLGFNDLSNTNANYFKGKTVKLGANITLNTGNAADWAAKAPANVWIPARFGGIFDGQGYTISGVYVKTDKQYNGFFHTVEKGAAVQNLKLVNSYIEGAYTGDVNRAGVGSVAGMNCGTINAVYSSAIVKNSRWMTGGIAGMSDGGTITNCWFDGQVYGGRATGGILGGAYAKAVNIEHCLNTGALTVTDGAQYVGGLCGDLQNACTAVIKDSLNAGTLTGSAAESGAIVGRVDTAAKLTLTDSYGVSEFLSSSIGAKSGAVTGNGYAARALADIKGLGAYQWMTLDFETTPYWVLKADAIPALVAFDTTDDLSVSDAKALPNYHWYNDSSDTYVISTVEQFYSYSLICGRADFVKKPVTLTSDVYVITTPEQMRGFAAVCHAEGVDYFKGKTVKLGANIDLGANTANWAATPAENIWTPVRFSGIFDGQGYTISGVYAKTSDGADHTGLFSTITGGAVVRNFKLVNSCIEGTKTSGRCGAGSIAGCNMGTIEMVYSNAIVKNLNGAAMTGGIAGVVLVDGTGTISNCWFDGQVYGGRATGGILGGAYKATANIYHCLNTGTLTVNNGSYYAGGLCGELQNVCTAEIRDSLNAGSLIGEVIQSGAIVGRLDNTASKLTLTDTYAVSGFLANAIGKQDGTVTGSNYAVRKLDDIKGLGAYQWMMLDFETTPYWVLKADAIPALAAFDTTDDLSVSEAKKLPNYHWYNDSGDSYALATADDLYSYSLICGRADFVAKPVSLTSGEYVITTANQLRAFAVVCVADGANQFAGKTVRLGADIALGANTADWAATPEDKVWTPIDFNGTFDGDGHTISEVYVYETGTYVGFFGTIEDGATVKNLKLTNSCIEHYGAAATNHDRAGVGSIAGMNCGTISMVYSDATVKNNKFMTGGIAGMSKGGVISNCWFAGQIYGGRATGGILGGAYKATANIYHCLNTGTVTVSNGSHYVGGLCGELQNICTAEIKDSLNAGSLIGTTTSSGAIVGRQDKADSKLTLENTYGVSEFLANAIGGQAGTVTGSNYAVVKLEDIKGLGAYQWMALDFETTPYWVLKADAIPALVAFDTTDDLNVADAKALPSYRWCNESGEGYVLTTVEDFCTYASICGRDDFKQRTVVLGSSEYILTTAEQLRAFAAVCNGGADFAGKTVKLGGNIDLGSDTADWTPAAFGGTFDGQGYTISGLRVNAEKAGFFSTLNSGAVVQNLNITNSSFQGTSVSGAVAAENLGTINKVYTTAAVVSGQTAGGIAGTGTGTITNCWFAGNVSGTTAGGILGSVGEGAVVEHCLNTGAVSGSTNAGGLIGHVTAAATVKDSLNAGTLSAVATNAGTVAGNVEGALTVAGVYGVKEFAANVFGAQTGTVTGTDYAARNLADIKGYGAYQWTALDFEGGHWVLKKDAIPALGAFDTTDLDLAHAKTLVNYSWYDAGTDTYVISTSEQLAGLAEIYYGSDPNCLEGKTVQLSGSVYNIGTAAQLRTFALICNADTNYFAGKTVMLTADIDLGANTSDWAATPKANQWTPITQFSGTFNGQGHTLSGVYVKATTKYVGFFRYVNSGAIVKNLKLVNSYIECKASERGGTGSIAGRIYGTIDTVYSSAIVKTSHEIIGGIAGLSNGGKITNCWFAGQIYGNTSAGGILGATYDSNATLTHCLNTGTMNIGSSKQRLGGLVGFLKGASKVAISDSVNAGKLVTTSTSQIGTIAGAIAENTLTVTNVYGVNDTGFGTALWRWKTATVTDGSEAKAVALADLNGKGAANLDYTNYWTARESSYPVLKSFAGLAG